MAAMSSKVLAEIQARAAMGRVLMADIEVNLDTKRGRCYQWIGGEKGHCGLVRRIPNQKIKICDDCPLWLTTDATYEEIHQTHVLQTYDWWRSEFVRTGQTYAKDRMVDFIKTWQPEPGPVPEPPTMHWYDYKTPLEVLLFGAFLGLVLGIVVQTIVVAWIF